MSSLLCCNAACLTEITSFLNNSSPQSNGRKINQERNQQRQVESKANMKAIFSSENSGQQKQEKSGTKMKESFYSETSGFLRNIGRHI
jgi:thermostable 8-oxoguanine DNA glycosylase